MDYFIITMKLNIMHTSTEKTVYNFCKQIKTLDLATWFSFMVLSPTQVFDF